MTIQTDRDRIRVRILTHDWVFPITKLYWQVKHWLLTVQTVLLEGWVGYCAIIWAGCLLWPGESLFAIAPYSFATLSRWTNEWVWGSFAVLIAIASVWGSIQREVELPVKGPHLRADRVSRSLSVRLDYIRFRPRTAAPVLSAIFYGAMAGGFFAQSGRLPGAWIYGGLSVVCLFVFWRRLLDE